MARLNRLAVAGLTHLVLLRGQGLRPICQDAQDHAALLAALWASAAETAVSVHAWCIAPSELWLLLTPPAAAVPAEPGAPPAITATTLLGRMMQGLGRRYVAAYNRRHGGRGSLWDGRFRSAVVAPGSARLDALRLVDGLDAPATGAAAPTSAEHRLGAQRDARLHDPPEYWALGNTPFEREAAWRTLLDPGLDPQRARDLRAAASGGWAVGPPAFAAEVAQAVQRPAHPRPRGRPRRS